MNSKEAYTREIGQKLLIEFGKFLDNHAYNLDILKGFFTNKQHLLDFSVLPVNSNYERVTVNDLSRSPNTQISKIVAALSGTLVELGKLKCDSHTLMTDFLRLTDDAQHPTELDALELNKIHVLIQTLCVHAERSKTVVRLFFEQFGKLAPTELTELRYGSTYPEMIEGMAEFLLGLVTIDYMLQKYQTVTFLNRIQVEIDLLSTHPDADFDLLKCLADQIKVLERYPKGFLFEQLLLSFDPKIKSQLKKSGVYSEMVAHIALLITDVEKDLDDMFATEKWMQICILLVVKFYMFEDLDKRSVRRLIELNKTFIATVLSGNVVWCAEGFLVTYIPKVAELLNLPLFQTAATAKLYMRTKCLPGLVEKYSLDTLQFAHALEEITREKMHDFEEFQLYELKDLFIDLLKFLKKLSEIIRWFYGMHITHNVPMSKTTTTCLCKMGDLMKTLHTTIQRRWGIIIYTILLLSEMMSYKISLCVQEYRNLYQLKYSIRVTQHFADVIASMLIAERSMQGPVSFQRLVVSKIAISIADIKKDRKEMMREIVRELEIIINLHTLYSQACNTCYVIWEEMLPAYFQKTIEAKCNLARYFYILQLLNDKKIIPGEKQPRPPRDVFEQVCQIIETNLRIQTHSHLDLSFIDPYLLWRINVYSLSPVRLNGTYFHMRKEIEHFLSEMFYNLTTVAMNDHKTYSDMRSLAKLEYGLNTVPDNLPTQTLEQGLDVLSIMRNIDLFVNRYLYNLNNQVFVEYESTSKHLNTISIKHVTNSIRAHGTGIMNSTVNFIYQFLQKKLIVYSQFMFDEIIKSRLLKDIRYFYDNRTQAVSWYPYDRAEKFNVGIRKLGLNNQGQSYLDLFRKLITDIGNAIGFVRMLRSGGRRCLGENAVFLAESGEKNLFRTLSENALLSSDSFEVLRDNIKLLLVKDDDTREYFALLINAFKPVFRNPNHHHLKNFYVIIPALTINFVEYSLSRKERLNKKNKNGASFTDDGFAIGLTFMLELLDQESQLKSLQWDSSIADKLKSETRKIAEQRDKRLDCNLEQTLELSEKRIVALKKEFSLLSYSFKSAKLFFKK